MWLKVKAAVQDMT